jgi:hypothetical protein
LSKITRKFGLGENWPNWHTFEALKIGLTRAVLELAGFFPVETITNRMNMSKKKTKFQCLVLLGHNLQTS